jgi:hypothetical protein
MVDRIPVRLILMEEITEAIRNGKPRGDCLIAIDPWGQASFATQRPVCARAVFTAWARDSTGPLPQ